MRVKNAKQSAKEIMKNIFVVASIIILHRTVGGVLKELLRKIGPLVYNTLVEG